MLASELSSAISRSENMPNYQVISNYNAELVQNEDAARIVMRIRVHNARLIFDTVRPLNYNTTAMLTQYKSSVNGRSQASFSKF